MAEAADGAQGAVQQSVAPAEEEKPAEGSVKFENVEAARDAERAALEVHNQVTAAAMPIRQYLESTVVPIVMAGMQAVVKERPDDPVEYLATYMLKNNPSKKA